MSAHMMNRSRATFALCLLALWLPFLAAADKDPVALQAQCDGGDMQACYDLAFAHSLGNGVTHDTDLAERLYKRACDAKHIPSCNNIAYIYSEMRDPKALAEAVRLFQVACDADFAPACGNLASLYERGDGVPKDTARALSLYRKGCSLNEPTVCHNLAMFYKFTSPPDIPRALFFFNKACTLDGGYACEMATKTAADYPDVSPKDD